MHLTRVKEFLKKEAFIIPIIVCLFFVPLFYNPYFIQSFTQSKEILFKIVVLVSLIGGSIMLLFRKKLKLRPLLISKLFLLVLVGFTIAIIANALSPTPIITLHGTFSRGFGLITDLYLFGLILYSAFLLSKNNIEKLLKWLYAGGVIVAVYALLQKIGIDPLLSYVDKDIFVGRMFSFLGNPGYLGQYMLLILIVNFYLLLGRSSKVVKIFLGIGFIAVAGALVFSETRTSILALIVCAGLALIKYRKKIASSLKKVSSAKILVSILFLISSIALSLNFIPAERFTVSENALRSVYSRFEIWDGATQLIQERPLLGYGGETFYIYSPEIITKAFLTLEEDINLSIDKVHNEFLEVFFSYGIFAAIMYIVIFLYLLKIFFTTENKTIALLSLIILANTIQNQFSFSDISIKIIIAFCFGGIIALQISRLKEKTMKLSNSKYIITAFILAGTIFSGYFTVYKPFMSQMAYATSHANYSVSYDISINEHKRALSYTPYYSALWYELMFLDPSSMERALFNLEQIEGASGNVLAWKGNFYTPTDPAKASEYYLQALEKNPYYPNWVRSYADMLYKYGDYENALYLYKKYLESVPDFWKWKDNLRSRTPEEQKTYRIFLKHVPDFWTTVERVEAIEKSISPLI